MITINDNDLPITVEELQSPIDEIKALEQQPSNEDVQRVVDYLLKPKSKPTSQDCVSRQAVLAIANDSCLDLDSYEDTKEFCDAIRELPPVTPTHGICKDCTKSKIPNEFEGYSIVCSRFIGE